MQINIELCFKMALGRKFWDHLASEIRYAQNASTNGMWSAKGEDNHLKV